MGFPDRNARTFPARCLERSATMSQDRSARTSPDRCRGKNARTFLVSSARMFPDSSARTFLGNSAAMFLTRSAPLFPVKNAGMFPASSASKCPGNSAPLLNLPMANNFAGLFYLKGSKLQYYAHIPQNLSLQREIIYFSNPQLYYLLTISIYLYSPSHWH